MRFNPSHPNVPWVKAIKHGVMFAKSSCLVVTDPLVSKKLLLETLEGEERLGENAVICVGPFQDAWQQTASKMLSKYDVVDINKEGWLVCNPKPGNSVSAVQITYEFYFDGEGMWSSHNMHDMNDVGDQAFHVLAQWGTKRGNDTVQCGTVGDWVLRSLDDPNDIWIVREVIFKNTYKVE